MMATLLHYPLCPASRAVRLALLESGIELSFSEIKPWAVTLDFLNINPAGTLPVLMIEGKTLCGAYPIVEYLSETAGREGPPSARSVLWTGTPSERAEQRRVAEWFLRKFDAEVTQSILDAKLYKPMSRGRLAPDLSIIRAGRSNLRYHLSYVSFLSDQRKWLGGDQPSFADLAASAQLSVMDYLYEMPWADFPEAKAWYQRLKSRPSFRSLLADRIPGFNPPEYYANLDF
jgi:glutathione S-transferase